MAIEGLLLLCLIWFRSSVFYSFNSLWLQPQKIRKILRQQGIGGPPPSFLYGNVIEMENLVKQEKPKGPIKHDYTPIMLPYFNKWKKEYGNFLSFFLSVSHQSVVLPLLTCYPMYANTILHIIWVDNDEV